MNGHIEIVPTIVPDTLADVKKVSEQYARFASFFQIDVTDGKFAPNTTWLPPKGYVLPKEYGYEVHLMVSEPGAVGQVFAEAGARSLIAHLEALPNAEESERMFAEWKRAGARSIGIAMLFQTPLEKIEPYLSHIDFVLLMTIPRIGVQGIPYEAGAPARIADFHARYQSVPIAVDGGVSEKNIVELTHAGARHFGVGSAISKASDPKAAYVKLLKLAEDATL